MTPTRTLAPRLDAKSDFTQLIRKLPKLEMACVCAKRSYPFHENFAIRLFSPGNRAEINQAF
jgi:hypothetical protein